MIDCNPPMQAGERVSGKKKWGEIKANKAGNVTGCSVGFTAAETALH